MNRVPPWLWIVGGVILIAALSTGGVVAVNYLSAAWMASDNAQKWAPFLSSVEDGVGIPSGLLSRIAYQESHFVQSIIDGTQSSPAGALGMMQLMPQFFQSVNVPTPYSDTDTMNQVNEAANFLVGLYSHFGNWTDAVAAYNAGQGNIDKVLAGKMALPGETANYIAQVSADLPGIVNPTLV
jgi:soluble lytic murein transglycosylase-like protein